ncbi:MAG: hypothetical protein RR346_01855, partial [Bacteroidales bacterium]
MIRLQGFLKAGMLGILSLLSLANYAGTTEIKNQYLHLWVKENTIQINSTQVARLMVKNLQVPGRIVSVEKMDKEDLLWGNGWQISVFCDDGRRLDLTLFDKNPFVFLHTTIENNTAADIRITDMSVASLELSVGDMVKANFLGSEGLSSANKPDGSFLYSLLTDPTSRNSILTGWLTQKQGVGYFLPSWNSRRNSYHLQVGLEFGNYLVATGKTRDTDTMIIGLFEDGREALELYGDYIAKAYQIQLPPRPEVYCTWYHRNLTGSGASTEEALIENARFAQKELYPFGLNTFQIDDHWQSSMIEGIDYKNQKEQASAQVGNGPLKSFAKHNFNFPAGMDAIAHNLNKEGF